MPFHAHEAPITRSLRAEPDLERPEREIFVCHICGERSLEICVRCTRDACDSHLCDRCARCSDCCVCFG